MYKLTPLIMLLFSLQLFAADYCVSTSEGFQLALDETAINQEPNHIRLVQGTYYGVNNGLSNSGFKWFHSNSEPLVISGGWLLQNNQCVQPNLAAEPRDTIINDAGFDRSFEVVVGLQELNLTVTNLYFKNGTSPPPIVGFLTKGAGLKIANNSHTSISGTVLLDRLHFESNRGVTYSALYVAGVTDLMVRNSAFYRNRPSHYGGLLIESPSDGQVFFVNNTFRGNSTDNTGVEAHAAAEFYTSPTSKLLIANNIFWGNSQFLDVLFTGSDNAEIWLLNNMFNYQEGLVPDHAMNNFSETIIEIDNDFNPYVFSAFINTGLIPDNSQAPAFEHNWHPGNLDFLGYPRIYGGGIDVGAGEQTEVLIFKAGFE